MPGFGTSRKHGPSYQLEISYTNQMLVDVGRRSLRLAEVNTASVPPGCGSLA